MSRTIWRRAVAVSLVAASLLAACAAPAPIASPAPTGAIDHGTPTPSSPDGAGAPPSADSPAPTPGTTAARPPSSAPGMTRLEPADGALFGLNLDWGSETAPQAASALGRTPAVWVQFARFPLDEGGVANLDAFIEQVEGVGGDALITLEPHDGLDAVTDEAAIELADLLARYWTEHGVATFVRFAHEMNGSWYPWSQQPEAYVATFRRVAEIVHDRSPASAMLWAPNQGSGYPFTGGRFQAPPGSGDEATLDTDGDGRLTAADDPYAPYYPGDDVVDWVGMSLYHWGLAYPWGENELPRPGTFAALLRGTDVGAHTVAAAAPDFYAEYAEGRDKPLAIAETAILYDPAASSGPTGAELKTAWFEEVFSEATRDEFPRIGMLSWFEWRKLEPEIGRVIDWRLAEDPALARALLEGAPADWLRYADH